jgi:hypothetical protein
MYHLWMMVTPVEGEAAAGVQSMLHGDTASLVRQIDARLYSLGAKIKEHPQVRSVNTEYDILQASTDVWREDQIEQQPTGLRLELYPCDEWGNNLDRSGDQVEPRGE